jgi:hypothetical protein
VLRSVIASLNPGTYTVKRRAAGTYTQGRYTAGAQTTLSIVADVQPVTGRELRDLPEGQRGDETKLVITETELRVRQPSSESDLVTIGGEDYRVVKVERWESFGDVHFECLVVRESKSA